MTEQKYLSTDITTVMIEVGAAGYRRYDKVVEVDLGDKSERGQNGLVVSEIMPSGERSAIPFQADVMDGRLSLALLMAGETEAHQQRHFFVEVAQAPSPQVDRPITVTDGITHEEQDSVRVATPATTYLYHKYGAGFASMIDQNENDWLSYHPWGGSDGKYRGIPNLVYPEGHFHPGSMTSTTSIVAQGPLRATLVSETNDGLWRCRWDILPDYARLTVERAARAYWFLYEGTPGGLFDPDNDYCVRSTAERTPASEVWQGAIPAPEWLYFGSGRTERVLYLIHHEADEAIDSYWPMQGNMTVFGFGRLNTDSFMTAVPSQFTVGFCESGDFASVEAAVNSAYRPLAIRISGKG